MKSGKVIKGRLAITFVNLGLATEIGVEKELITSDTPEEEVKSIRKRRTKAEIEAEKKSKK